MPKNVDLAKRRRIMQRSMTLGHCICDPTKPCPCDTFKNDGLCPCAGERPDPVAMDEVRLTELVHNAGCASKISPVDLEAVLNRLPSVDDPAVLCGIPAGDDAGIYQLAEDVRLVQTVDVFTPCVDDPELFGRICAANCLSDIYAMGGIPRTALSVLGFPSETLDGRIMYHMMKGAMDVLAEAGVALIGGHSIKDQEIKLGFAITGTIDERALTRDTLAVGDRLVLTKPLGVGVLNFARQIGRPMAGLADAERSMATLNRAAADAMRAAEASACTDVTGFGLFGHLVSMVRHSGVTVQVWADRLPAFPGARELLADGVIPGAIERNREFVAGDISVAEGVDAASVELGFDAQTSGGLLIGVGADRYDALLAELNARGAAGVTVGVVVGESAGQILVTASDQSAEAAPAIDQESDMPGHRPALASAPAQGGSCCESVEAPCCESQASSCCDPAAEAPAQPGHSASWCASAGAEASTSAETARAFGALMRSAGEAGAIDERTKELITFTLTLATRCEPCVKAHLAQAREAGITQAELDEAAWLATAMGGAPVRMFYLAALEAENGSGGKSCC